SEREALAASSRAAQRSAVANELYQYLLAGIGLLLLGLSIVTTNYVRKALAREDAARRELEVFAMTDALTALPNRRSFMSDLSREIAASQAEQTPRLSLAIFDIDHFK
ncbi:MAG TPA: diguanylate cyclase, partial [Erythrobacter sp.]|nr:diguanylate cyclase [Erythrobacter sp.]